MPQRKSSKTTTTKATRTAKAVKAEKGTNGLRLPQINVTRSYTSLIYGVVAVIILFLLIYAGVKALSQRDNNITEEGANTQQEQQAGEQGVYTVKEGDTLWSISEKEYGTGYNWTEIAKANKLQNPGDIEKGQKLTLPEKAKEEAEVAKAPATPTPTAAQEPEKEQTTADKITGDTYKVQQGEFLWEIAVRAYGDGYKWVDIAKANNLVNPDVIHTGNVLKLPR